METKSIYWIVLFNHRHGLDVWPEYRANVGEEDIIAELRAADEWDERDDEDDLTYLEVRGPFSFETANCRLPSNK